MRTMEIKFMDIFAKEKLWLADVIPKHLLDENPEEEKEARCCVGFSHYFPCEGCSVDG